MTKNVAATLLCALFCLGADTASTRSSAPEIRRGMVYAPTTNPEDRAERQRNAFETIARKIEPDLKGDPSRLPVYLEFFKREFVKDPRLFAFNATIEPRDGTIRITGNAEYREHQQAIERLLRTLGFDRIDNSIDQLPATDLGEQRFAFVIANHAPLLDRPQTPHEQVSDCLKDEPLFLLRKSSSDAGDFFLCHNIEGYVGYVAAKDVHVVDQAEFVSRQRDEKVDPRIDRVIDSAKSLLGTTYVWGGKTSEGLDCSGLVQRSFKAACVNLPRDADQQALVGRMIATRWCRDLLRRGDVLFFLGRRGTVSHTAIYLGDGKYIEAAGSVKISNFDDANDESGHRRADSFCFARRVFE
jgi:cell wall-associated NlpC family hydrolase